MIRKAYYYLNWRLNIFCWKETKKDHMFVTAYRYKQLYEGGTV